MLYDAHKENLKTKDELGIDQHINLSHVGMDSIQVPILYKDLSLIADLSIFVNLNDLAARGIHMSRLYTLVSKRVANLEINLSHLACALGEAITSQEGLSNLAHMRIDFRIPLKKISLVSKLESLHSYEVSVLIVKKNSDEIRNLLYIKIPYSSTCPQSAALARQLIQNKLDEQFSESIIDKSEIYNWLGTSNGVVATPHAQRSYAEIWIELENINSNSDIVWEKWVDLIENALGTPVQGLVKRADEQEFALRNGQNLMFCEDAARRVGRVLALEIVNKSIKSYRAKLSHHESLHAHNATAYVQSGHELEAYFSF
jgi:GTP cyclohydrolase I